MVVLTKEIKSKMKKFAYVHLLLASVCLVLLFLAPSFGRTKGTMLFLLLASVNIVSTGLIAILSKRKTLFE